MTAELASTCRAGIEILSIGFRMRNYLLVFATLINLFGCVDMKLTDVSKETPEFDFEAYFTGYTKASGWFSDRFGNVRRHFCGDFIGERAGDKFVLKETLYFSDGVEENRIWTIDFDEQGFTASSPSLVGNALARVKGNALQMS